MSEQTTEQLAAANDDLRRELEHQQAELKKQIADTAQQASGGLTDEHVRRLEHPDEFADDDTADADAGDDDDPASTAPVAPAAETGHPDNPPAGPFPPRHGFPFTAAGSDEQTAGVAFPFSGVGSQPAGEPDGPQEPAQELHDRAAARSLLARLEAQAADIRRKLGL